MKELLQFVFFIGFFLSLMIGAWVLHPILGIMFICLLGLGLTQ